MKSLRNNFLSKHLINYPSPVIFFVIPGIVMTFVFPFFLQNVLFQEVDASHCVKYYPQIITIGIILIIQSPFCADTMNNTIVEE
jgi:hypothetical protein